MNDEKVLSLFSSPKALGLKQNPLDFKTGAIALPEFGTSFVQGLLKKPLPIPSMTC
jgi:DNA polymerase-3 subunit alpha (Gram-positive type)